MKQIYMTVGEYKEILKARLDSLKEERRKNYEKQDNVLNFDLKDQDDIYIVGHNLNSLIGQYTSELEMIENDGISSDQIMLFAIEDGEEVPIGKQRNNG